MQCLASRLGDMYGLADHQTAMEHEYQCDGVKFKRCAFCRNSQRYIVENPTLGDPVGHD